jgi:hypothetical protein
MATSASESAAGPSPALPRLPDPVTIDDVIDTLDRILEWSIAASSTIGYFAAIYKRVTVAIRQAAENGEFANGPLIEELDVAFAQRYFSALNSFFYPDDYAAVTLPWEVAFLGSASGKATMLQHMMAGLNAHITFDLGLALVKVAPNALQDLEGDYHRVNALLCSQIPGMLDIVGTLSPQVLLIRRLLPGEIIVLKRMLTKLRESAWLFAINMAMHPDKERERRVNQSSWTAAMGAWYLHPPRRLRPVPVLVRAIARRESRDIPTNLQALQGLTEEPARLNPVFLPKAQASTSRA